MPGRLYRLLLRLLPSEYDERDRQEMWETHQKRVARVRGERGGLAALREQAGETVDLLGTLFGALVSVPTLDSLVQDVRTALRSLVRTPLVSALAILSLALGIGATSAIFSALDVWILRPLPLPNADRLVQVAMANRERGWNQNAFSPRDYADWAAASASVDLMVYASGSYNLSVEGRAERVSALTVSANATQVLGIEPALGRSFTPEEGRAGGPRVTLLSDAFWQRSMGRDRSIVGQSVILDGVAFTVVGVLPRGQGIPGEQADVWVPLRVSGEEPRSGHYLWGVGLLADGIGPDIAQAELDAVAAGVVEQDPERTFPNAFVRPFREAVYGPEFTQGGLVIGFAVLFVLLIACANIANLLLARGQGRTHEFAVRGSLGAPRARILQQLLVESGVIALLGGVVGLGVAVVGIHLLLTYGLPAFVPGWNEIGLNRRVLLGATALTVLSAFVFGLVPALRSSDVDFRERMADNGRGGSSPGRSKLATALVVGEISATLVLVVLAGLLIRSMVAMKSVDMGMRTTDALVFRLDVPRESRADAEALAAFYEELEERLSAEPGVTGMATASGHVLQRWSTFLYAVPSKQGDEPPRQSAEYRRVTSGYLDVMDLEMVAGRWIDPAADIADGPPVALVSRALVEQWWAEPSEALGQTLRIGDQLREIVGVVDPGRIRGPQNAPPPLIFVPFAQSPSRYTFNVVTHRLENGEAVAAVRRAVQDIDSDLAVFQAMPIEAAFEETLGPTTSGFRVLGALGVLALVLTLVGVYGVMAHSVGRRTREMGLRMAVGADGPSLVRMVLAGNARTAAWGIAIGLLLSLAGGRAVAFLLVGVSPHDPIVLASVTAALFSAVVVASYLPARRAARVDPVQTLRGD